MKALTLRPGGVTLSDLAKIYFDGATARLDPNRREAVEAAARLVAEAADEFGYLGVQKGPEPVHIGVELQLNPRIDKKIPDGHEYLLRSAISTVPANVSIVAPPQI